MIGLDYLIMVKKQLTLKVNLSGLPVVSLILKMVIGLQTYWDKNNPKGCDNLNDRFELNFRTNDLIAKFEKLKSGEITEDELDLSERNIRWILLSLKTTHAWEELLDNDLGLREV